MRVAKIRSVLVQSTIETGFGNSVTHVIGIGRYRIEGLIDRISAMNSKPTVFQLAASGSRWFGKPGRVCGLSLRGIPRHVESLAAKPSQTLRLFRINQLSSGDNRHRGEIFFALGAEAPHFQKRPQIRRVIACAKPSPAFNVAFGLWF